MIRVAALALAAQPAAADPEAALAAFAGNCFSPLLTAETARARIAPHARLDFYDLAPFADVPPSPATGRAPTPGTDRRCEVAFDGGHVPQAIAAATAALDSEGIRIPAEVPAGFAPAPGVAFTAARHLNPRRIAVVMAGTRPGPDGTETFLAVERLDPLP